MRDLKKDKVTTAKCPTCGRYMERAESRGVRWRCTNRRCRDGRRN